MGGHNGNRCVLPEKSVPFPGHRFEPEEYPEEDGVGTAVGHYDQAGIVVVHRPELRMLLCQPCYPSLGE